MSILLLSFCLSVQHCKLNSGGFSTHRINATVKVILGREKHGVPDEDERCSKDEGEEELDVDEVSRAVESPEGQRT